MPVVFIQAKMREWGENLLGSIAEGKTDEVARRGREAQSILPSFVLSLRLPQVRFGYSDNYLLCWLLHR